MGGLTSWPRSEKVPQAQRKSTSAVHATVLESLHIIKCVNLAPGMCEPENQRKAGCVFVCTCT